MSRGVPNQIAKRKLDHINICVNDKIEPLRESPFQKWKLPYKAIPELDMDTIDMKTKFFKWEISCPLIVASMTGGEEHGRTINENIAKACNAEGIPFGLGSMRIMTRYPESKHTFDVKSCCPNVPMFANIGLVQLNYGVTAKDINKLVDDVKADGLFIHVNHLQEAVQPEGDVNFSGLMKKLSELLPQITVPVIVKEVGHGFDAASAKLLWDAGIKVIDVAGVGGCSWAWIEGRRQKDYTEEENLGYIMRDFGVPTDSSIIECRQALPEVQLVASGGLRNGLDMAKAISLGADFVSCAKPFLKAAMTSSEEVQRLIQRYKKELRVSMFAAGASNISELKQLSAVVSKI